MALGRYESVDGPDQYRYAALKVLFSGFGRCQAPIVISGDSRVEDNAFCIIASNVRVQGRLVVDSQALVFVLGSLVVEGDLAEPQPDVTWASSHVTRELRYQALAARAAFKMRKPASKVASVDFTKNSWTKTATRPSLRTT